LKRYHVEEVLGVGSRKFIPSEAAGSAGSASQQIEGPPPRRPGAKNQEPVEPAQLSNSSQVFRILPRFSGAAGSAMSSPSCRRASRLQLEQHGVGANHDQQGNACSPRLDRLRRSPGGVCRLWSLRPAVQEPHPVSAGELGLGRPWQGAWRRPARPAASGARNRRTGSASSNWLKPRRRQAAPYPLARYRSPAPKASSSADETLAPTADLRKRIPRRSVDGVGKPPASFRVESIGSRPAIEDRVAHRRDFTVSRRCAAGLLAQGRQKRIRVSLGSR
jgi:hypothetical protein